ncbi:hypothetical protein CMP1-73 [Clavibacter phage CMP1]|uniref:Uncharacterized protein n=1 Tax=Clavibacter phage CMP1 TaxID=686439 RepID=D0U257_9CAUD|nr:hypothetical protein CMP1-73 [Clavibacter phage CMP1]ACY35965.1 hypothetical protein CMP1-73 [Clavibacter phage CMP1]
MSTSARYAATQRKDSTHVVTVWLPRPMTADELRPKIASIRRYAADLSRAKYPRAPKPAGLSWRDAWHLAPADVAAIEAQPGPR